MLKLLIILLQIATGLVAAWDDSYIKISNKEKKKENDVSKVTFKLYSTKFYQPDQNVYENIKFDEATKTASLKQGSMYDDSIKTLVVAHGNGGGYPLDKDLWAHYSQAATVTGAHYNIIGIRWGSGWTEKHAFVGIKAARVIQSLKENYNLDVANLHAIGWSYGANVVNAMASEIVFSQMGKIERLTLLDPGRKQKEYKIKGNPVKQIGFFNRTFADFVDVYHTSKTGVYDRPLGHADIWINGGQTQPEGIEDGAHRAASTFYANSIINPSGSCQYYMALQCQDPDWKPFLYNDRNKAKADTCEYGDQEAMESTLVGEYINTKEAIGNYLIFITKNYQYCQDINCTDICPE